jgi:putative colanic acid biosynthesis glycosyltransferase
LKVLLIDVNCKHSSTGKIVYDLYQGINASGNTAAICYGRGPLIEEPNIYKFGLDLETYFHAFMTRLTGFTGYFSPFSTRRLLKYMKQYQPDVVHIHELHGYFVNINPIIKYLKKNNIKTVWTFHCEFMYTGKCGQSFECEKWKTECHHCPQKREYPKSLFFDFTRIMFNHKLKWLHSFDNLLIITPSKWLEERVHKSILKKIPTKVINNGINIHDLFYPRNTNNLVAKHSLNGKKVVISVAPHIMSDQKGGGWFLNLAEKFILDNVTFIMIGVDDLNISISRNVIILGRTSNQDELAQYYSLADVFVICGKNESFPTTCIESIACGTPVIGFDSGGTSETTDFGIGEFIPYGDLNGLTMLLKRYLFDIESHRSKKEISEYGAKRFNKIRMVNDYLEVYTEL